MYSTCLFCNRDLGANESLETFPVGRRLAFDAAKGRLWVVCRSCERWNLTPLEERWEAIEQAERLYRDTRRRVSTDQIGLAKLRDGTELVRIGEPLRPEFAAWRYGDQFGRRRRKQMLIAGAGVVAAGGLFAGGAAAGIGIGGFGWLFSRLGATIVHGRPDAVVARIGTSDGMILPVRRRHLAETRIVQGAHEPIGIVLRYKNGQRQFEGREALRVASLVIPHVNRFGGAKQTVADAVSQLEDYGGPDAFLDRIGQTAHVLMRPEGTGRRRRRRGWRGGQPTTGLFSLHQVQRLALEMALNEEAERRAMEGELGELEAAWKQAEEIAAIADDMFLPGGVETSLVRLKAQDLESGMP